MADSILNILQYLYDFVTVTMAGVVRAFVIPLRTLISELLSETSLDGWVKAVLERLADSTINTNLTLLEICLFGAVSYVVVANIVKFVLSIFRG